MYTHIYICIYIYIYIERERDIHIHILHSIVSKGWVARAPLLLKGNDVILHYVR